MIEIYSAKMNLLRIQKHDYLLYSKNGYHRVPTYHKVSSKWSYTYLEAPICVMFPNGQRNL